jgi:drug/metabolite transporter (DMT)-like permease
MVTRRYGFQLNFGKHPIAAARNAQRHAGLRECTPVSTPATAAPSATPAASRLAAPLLAWCFVAVWGSGYVASKTGLQYAPPFTFLCLRFATGLALLAPPAWWWHRREPLRFPRARAEWGHLIVAGLLMHAINLGGSHYSQYLGMSAGVTALILATQPLVTACVAGTVLHERVRPWQWLGVAVGLIGVALIVWHKIDVRAVSLGALVAVTTSLAAITVGTLYQRRYCPTADLRAASVVQFAATLLVLAPLALLIEGAPVTWSRPLAVAVAFLVLFASIFAVNALHTLIRRGEVTRVTSLLYLTPIFAVVLEWALFLVVPSALTLAGIAVTCAGVALVAWAPKAPTKAHQAARSSA